MRIAATHCKKGHLFTEESTYVNPRNGQRLCRICQADATRRRRESGTIKKPTFNERFFSFINKTETCWIWTGALNEAGYGMISDRSVKSGSTAKRAHRVSYEIHKGEIPPGLHILHTCDNPKCVNPGHLILGTNLDNVKDMVSKKRHWAHNQTHCKNGHEFTEANTYYYKDNRCCRQCVNMRSNKRYHAKKSMR